MNIYCGKYPANNEIAMLMSFLSWDLGSKMERNLQIDDVRFRWEVLQ